VSGELRFEQRMSDSDALMWSIEKDPMLRSTITAVLLLDGAPDAARFRHLLDRGTRLVPRMRQRVRGNPLSVAPPRWEVDPNFDLDFHIRTVRAGGSRDLRAVLDLAEPIAMAGFDRARPLWEALVVEDVAIEGRDEPGAAVIMKIHHAITDGVGAVQIAMVMFELERDASLGEMPDAPAVKVMSQLERFIDAFEHERRRNLGVAKRVPDVAVQATSAVITDPLGTAKRVRETVASVVRMAAPSNEALSPLLVRRSLSVHFDTIVVGLDPAKAAAKRAGGRLNDAFLAATAAGMRRYHEAMGNPVEHVRLSMPVNVRTEANADATGNNFAPVRFAMPVSITEPVESMATMRALVAEQRAEPALDLVDPLSRILNRLPTSVTTSLFGAALRGIDVTASNVPGAPIPIYTAGSEILAMFALGPMAGAASNLTLLSYRGDLCIGVNVDPAAVTDPELFVRCLREGWDEVLAVANGSPAPKKTTAKTTAPTASKTAAKKTAPAAKKAAARKTTVAKKTAPAKKASPPGS
jgi:diacylglycerol O-acyltransferase